MTARSVVAAAVVALLGVGLTALGAWGYRSAYRLAPAALDPDERAHRGGVLRAGAVGLVLVGLVLVLGAGVGLALG